MAKKSTKKSVKKAAKKPAKKPAKKAAAKKPKAAKIAAPKAIKTGRGSTPAQIGDAVVASINAGRPDKDIWDKFWSPAVVSIEGTGVAMAWSGRKAMESKCQGWLSANTIHGCSAEGPFLGATGFSIKLRMDTEDKSTGKRTLMEEVAVYTVQNGKVVREEFMYGPVTTVAAPAAPSADGEPAPTAG